MYCWRVAGDHCEVAYECVRLSMYVGHPAFPPSASHPPIAAVALPKYPECTLWKIQTHAWSPGAQPGDMTLDRINTPLDIRIHCLQHPAVQCCIYTAISGREQLLVYGELLHTA